MKILALLLLSLASFGQSIPGSRLTDGTVTEPKLAPDALRPINSGALGSDVLTFDEVEERFTLDVSADHALTLGGGNVAHSKIIITATGDGTHVVTFPATWKYKNGSDLYDASFVNVIELTYDGTYVWINIENAEENIEVTLTLAEVTEATLNTINLTFSNAVTIDISGWSVSATDPVTILGVTGSGTAIPIFSLSRDIIAGETVTISYAPASGSTTSLSGNEIETISAQAVTALISLL